MRHLLGGLPRSRARLLALLVVPAVSLALVPGRAPARTPGPALLAVTARTSEQVATLVERFDLVETRDGDRYQVVAWPGDRARLQALGFELETLVPDLSDEKVLPGPADYRRLADYEAELQALAADFPGHVRLITGAEPTLEDRTVYGVEIAGDVAAQDGRPVAYIDGIHHAREWPAGELPMNFAHQLAEAYSVDPVLTELLDRVRVLIVPVMNPDGFHHSRESLVGDGVPEVVFGVAAGGQGTYWRKNRRGLAHAAGVSVGSYGVDPNRNYAFLWGVASAGGSEASIFPLDQTYHGPAPFSEPETRNVRSFILGTNVTAAITNHTVAGLVLWPWGHTSEPPPDPGVVQLGRQLATLTGYRGQPSIHLYPTKGTAEDWIYASTGAYAYTFEIGRAGFHPPGGPEDDVRVRAAYVRMLEWAADPAHHSIVRGSVSDGASPIAASLRMTKTFVTPVSKGYPLGTDHVTETIDLSMQAGEDGAFAWHVSPSTRPVAPTAESYRLTISAPGFQDAIRTVAVARGQVRDLGTIVLTPA